MKLYEKLLLGTAGAAGAGATAWRTLFPWIGYDLQLMKLGRRIGKERDEALKSLLIDKFEGHVANNPKKPFIVFEDSVYTYEFVDQMACKVANIAKTWGLKPRDTVAIVITNEPAFVWTFLGLQKLGIAVAFINYNLKMAPLVHSIKAANSKCLIVGQGETLLENVLDVQDSLSGIDIYVQGMGNRPPPLGMHSFDPLMMAAHSSGIDPKVRSCITLEDICCFIYTSGTTGNPKPVFIQQAKTLGISCGLGAVAFQSSDSLYIVLPLYHSAGGGLGLFAALRQGNPKPVFIQHEKSVSMGCLSALSNLEAKDILYLALPLYHTAGGGLVLFAALRKGNPKPVFIRHEKAIQISCLLEVCDMEANAILYVPLPLYHTAGGGVALFAALKKGPPKAAIVRHARAVSLSTRMSAIDFQTNDILYTALPLYHTVASGLGLFAVMRTGNPKPCLIKHLKACINCCIVECIHLQPSDRLYLVMPLYHSAAGATGFFGALHQGATVVLKRKFSASQFWSDCCRYDVTVIQYIGELFRYLLAQPPSKYDTEHKVRAAFGNGLRKDIWNDVNKRYKIPFIAEFFGATEGVSLMLNVANKPGAIGRLSPFLNSLVPDPSFLVKFDYGTAQPIRDENGRCIKVKIGEPGLFLSRVPEHLIKNQQFDVYMSSKEANEKKLVRGAFKDGDIYFNYGDVFVLDEEYFIYFKDRIGDTFRWKGENVSTTELANVITTLDFVQDANVYGVLIPGHDGRAGMVALTLNEGTKLGDKELKEVFDHVKESLPEYAQPLFLRLLDQAILTGTFKQRKVELVEQGYDVNTVKDPVYFKDVKNGTYSPLKPTDLPKFLSSKL